MEFTVNLPFITSIAVNVLLIVIIAISCWYSFRLLKKIYFVTDTLSEINKQITEFLSHLETVYTMEMFYGDPTLQNLLQHAKELKIFVDDYLIQVMPDDHPPGEEIIDEEVENEYEDEDNEQETK